MIKTKHVHESRPLVSNSDATFQIPVFGTIHNLSLRFTIAGGGDASEANMRSELGVVRVSLGGKDIINASVARILDLYEVLAVNVAVPTAVPGTLELNLGRLLYTDPMVRDIFALGTKDMTSLQITVTTGTLVTITAAQAFTSRDDRVQSLGAHCKYVTFPVNFNSTGDHTVDSLPRDLDSAYVLVLVDDGATGVISHGECRLNSRTIQERLPISINALYLSSDRLAQPPGYYVYAFTDGKLTDALPMLNTTDLRFIQTFSTAPGAAGYFISPLTVVNLPLPAVATR